MQWLKQWLCSHDYEAIADLKSDDEKSVRIVRMCKYCAHVVEKTFRAPGTCDHKWMIYKEQKITKLNRGYSDLIGTLFIHKCLHCGVMREQRLSINNT